MAATTANNQFGLDLFRLIFEDNKTTNTFFSPFSISVALAMTQLGAREKTASDMSSTLRWPPGQEEQIHGDFKSYLALLQNKSDSYQLSSANRLFVEKNYPILEDFLKKTKEFYLAGRQYTQILKAWMILCPFNFYLV